MFVSPVPASVRCCHGYRGSRRSGRCTAVGRRGLTQRLRAASTPARAPTSPPHSAAGPHAVPSLLKMSSGDNTSHRPHRPAAAGPHAVPSLLKMYFRELPNPLAHTSYRNSVSCDVRRRARLRAVRDAVVKTAAAAL
ncbi:unnamed protein product [Chrysodeixis includens]|uniref:Rho-GAP domain-containing protein n=1 Tax=Chrysodeixis includens TaxID=689277 RepID=A0A9N8Q0D5_CHRIL|nr:unnamed protein product [Chrysodeixis includens]